MISKLLWLGAAIVTATPAFAEDCNCSTYLDTETMNGVVVDNGTGAMDFVFAITSDSLDRSPTYARRNRVGIPVEAIDCSVGGVACVDIPARKTLLAFRPGKVGDTYAVRGVVFKIEAVGRVVDAASGPRVIYWVTFAGSPQYLSGEFVYAEPTGVVRYTIRSTSTPVMRLNRFLLDGPGFLSERGFPKGKKPQ